MIAEKSQPPSPRKPQGMAPIHLRAGDIFVIEPGMKGTWEVVETVRKYFVFA